MTSHITDSEIYGALFAPPEVAAIFSDRGRVQKWFDVEIALAEAQAELGIVPAAAAAEIRRKARAENVDLAEIGAGVRQTAHPLVPAIRALEHLCENGAGEFVHHGVTTQDIIDTGLVLQVKEAWPLLLRDLAAVRNAFAAIARTHKDTVMVGRTHGQQALPMTFGFKVAIWVDEIDRQLERCREAEPRLCVGNITGAIGTMAGLGEQGMAVQEGALKRLGLGVPKICWHPARDRIFELACLLTQIGATMGKIAREVYSLQHHELGELREPFHMGKVGSSTMPHKQNPSNSELVVALSRLLRGLLLPLSDALFHEHERDAGLLRIELAAVPEAVIYTGAILSRMRVIAEGLEARPERMRENADLLGGLLLSERVMLVLGEHIGKQTAHEVVYEVAMAAQEQNRPFREALMQDDRITPHLDAAAIEALLDPAAYIGLSAALVDNLLGDGT